jgi:hypothetical protein
MIELNLLEKKKPLVLPSVLGIDLNTLNLKMLGVAIIVYYLPGPIINFMYEDKIVAVEAEIAQSTEINKKLTQSISKNEDVKTQVQVYKEQVVRLQQRSTQVDEILKSRTNPKKVLEKIARSIPEDVWFESLIINDKHEIAIQGGAFNPRAIGDFINNINDSPYFGGSIVPSIQENRNEVMEGVTTPYEYFELKGKVLNYDMRSR